METIIRPLPVPGNVAIRSALLALANLEAELQTYNEEGRTIVAKLPKRLGLGKAAVLITVQDFGENSRLEVQLPDKQKAEDLLNQISLYLVDGHRAAGDMTMRWVEKQEETLAQSAGKSVGKALRRLTAGGEQTGSVDSASADGAVMEKDTTTPIAEEDITIIEPDTLEEASASQAQEIESGEVAKDAGRDEPITTEAIEQNGPTQHQENKLIVPDFLTADQQQSRVNIHVSPDFFVDRSSHLETCPTCETVVLRGSQFCSQCGRPITMDAVSKEVNEGGRNTARSSLIFAGLAVVCNLVAIYFLFAPVIVSFFTETEVAPFSPISLMLTLFLGIFPSLLLGNEARRMAKTAEIYLKFSFNKEQQGRSLAYWGALISWISIGINVFLVIMLMIRNFF